MTTTMTSPLHTERPDWQPGHVPRLSYRNPLPAGESVPQRDTATELSSTRQSDRPGLSIREIREALPQNEPFGYSSRSQVSPPPVLAQKTRKSFLGGLFAKEPSMAALDQVAQNMMAQHGSISPKVIPHVSSQKMPEHVPRVNSKWDGVPDYVKMKEKEEKQRARVDARGSLRPVLSTSRSTDIQDDQSMIRRRNSNAASTAESWDSRSADSRLLFHDNSVMRPESISSTSSGGSIHRAQRSNIATYQSYSYPLDSKSLVTSVSCVDEPRSPHHGPQRLPSSLSTVTQTSYSSEQSRSEYFPVVLAPSADTIPEYTSSAATTPLERSPQTPAPFPEDEKRLEAMLRDEPVLSAPTAAKPATARPNNPKKASRTGLGLHTSNLVAPWESQTATYESPKSPQADSPAKSRNRIRLLGKDRK